MRILLVDDDEHVLHTLAEALVDIGHELLCAPNASQALGSLDDCELIITDVRMPGMDGLELLSTIRGRRPDLPVVLITGHGDEDTAIAALQRGAADYLRKRLRLRSLTAAISKVERQLEERLQEEQLQERLEESQRQRALMESRFVHAEKLSALGLMAPLIAHEIKSPLQAIFAYTDFALHELQDDSPEARRLTSCRISNPSIPGILMSLTTMSTEFDSMYARAVAPSVKASTLWCCSRRNSATVPRIAGSSSMTTMLGTWALSLAMSSSSG